MKNQSIVCLLFPGLFFFGNANAQGKIKFGLGGNVISNNAYVEQLGTYTAASLHFNYVIVKAQALNLEVESASSFKGRSNIFETTLGFTTALPVMIDYKIKKAHFLLGSGPAFIAQKYYDAIYHQHSNGLCLNFTCGGGLNLKPIALDAILPQVDLHISYFKGIRDSELDIAMLSLILYLGRN